MLRGWVESAPVASDQYFWDRDGVNQPSTALPIKLKSLMLRRFDCQPRQERHRSLSSDDKRFCKSPGHSQVLKDISRDVEQGRVTTLPGASGSGKSTFLRCLNQENGR